MAVIALKKGKALLYHTVNARDLNMVILMVLKEEKHNNLLV